MDPTNTRRLIWLVAILAAVAAVVLYLKLSSTTLIGTWANPAQEDRIVFVFSEDGTGSFTIGDKKVFDYHYTLDESRSPLWLDLEAVASDESTGTVLAIVEFAPWGKLKIRMPPTQTPNVRPTAFEDHDLEDTILLRRIESPS